MPNRGRLEVSRSQLDISVIHRTNDAGCRTLRMSMQCAYWSKMLKEQPFSIMSACSIMEHHHDCFQYFFDSHLIHFRNDPDMLIIGNYGIFILYLTLHWNLFSWYSLICRTELWPSKSPDGNLVCVSCTLDNVKWFEDDQARISWNSHKSSGNSYQPGKLMKICIF